MGPSDCPLPPLKGSDVGALHVFGIGYVGVYKGYAFKGPYGPY